MAIKTIEQIKALFSSGKKPTGKDFSDLVDATYNQPIEEDNKHELIMDIHKHDTSPHQYGGKFEWRYNPITNSLDLVVLD